MQSEKWRRLKVLTTEYVASVGNVTTLYLSKNEKTGLSINLPVALTCFGRTKACTAYCYATQSRLAMSMSLVRQVQNYVRFEHLATAPIADVVQEADRIAGGVSYFGHSFLRVFGSGDLQPGSVRFINTLAKRHPKLALWVSTRQFTLAQGLSRAKNLHLMLSTDGTTLKKDWEAVRRLAKTRGPNTYIAYVQREEADVAPPDVKIVFAEHRGSSRGAWTVDDADPRTCPATVKGGEPHTDACARCRFCFDAPKRLVQLRLTDR